MDMDNNKECMCLAVSFKLFLTEFLVERGDCDGSGVDHIEDKQKISEVIYIADPHVVVSRDPIVIAGVRVGTGFQFASIIFPEEITAEFSLLSVQHE